MKDDRLQELQSMVAETRAAYSAGPVRIDRIKISNYKFFHGDFELAFNGKNVLIYGENGTGKSSIYRALEFLTKKEFKTISEHRNIFAEEGDVLIEFGFTNARELIIHPDLTELPEGMDFIKGLSVFTPMLDYKKLLRVHYIPQANGDKINVYEMLRLLFKDYPIDEDNPLSSIKDFTLYFDTLKKIVSGELLSDINDLINYFETDFKIASFNFKTIFTEEGRPEPIVSIDIDFRDTILESYHSFLNEARLSALAVSIYFAVIKKLLGTLKGDCLKILVLDDLLISLDMSNRLKLLEILKDRFTDFQIFFFTHDKKLFEIYRNKMPWEQYEFYLDDTDPIHKPIIKKGSSDIERAKEFYAHKEYDCCALLLRKDFEKLLKSYLTPKEQRDKNCNELDLASLIGRAISKSAGEAKAILEKLNIDRKHILNPLSHNDDRNIYS
ncbi:MAG: AAA family ATPase [Pseudomonadota bacterium]